MTVDAISIFAIFESTSVLIVPFNCQIRFSNFTWLKIHVFMLLIHILELIDTFVRQRLLNFERKFMLIGALAGSEPESPTLWPPRLLFWESKRRLPFFRLFASSFNRLFEPRGEWRKISPNTLDINIQQTKKCFTPGPRSLRPKIFLHFKQGLNRPKLTFHFENYFWENMISSSLNSFALHKSQNLSSGRLA